MKRRRFHVTKRPDGGWQVKEEGVDEPCVKVDTKATAIACGKEVAKAAKPSQLIVHKENGQFEDEYTYGGDPYPPAG